MPLPITLRYCPQSANSLLNDIGYWNDYDVEKMNSSYTSYAQALTSVFTE